MEKDIPLTVNVWNEGKASLIYINLSEYVPSIRYYTGFWSDPHKVIKYGSNGLHFCEHILWSLINEKYKFKDSNASTFDTGDMFIYGKSPYEEYKKAITGLFKALTNITNRKMTKNFKNNRYYIEQRRVTSETFMLRDNGWVRDNGMFMANSDMKEGDFPHEYFWRIMLNDSILGKVIILTTKAPSEEMITLFKRLAVNFTSSWEKRKKKVGKIKYPMFQFPPMSLILNTNDKTSIKSLENWRRSTERYNLLSVDKLSLITGFILKSYINKGYSLFPTPLTEKDNKTLLSNKWDGIDKIHAMKFLKVGTGNFSSLCMVLSTNLGDISEAELLDLINPSMTPKKLIKKYKDNIEKAMNELREFLI